MTRSGAGQPSEFRKTRCQILDLKQLRDGHPAKRQDDIKGYLNVEIQMAAIELCIRLLMLSGDQKFGLQP
jgi:hypothetical protein